MAKVVFSQTAEYTVIYQYYSGDFTLEVNKRGSEAHFQDNQTGASIDIFGSGLKANSKGFFTAGAIGELVLVNPMGETVVTVDGDYKAADLSKAASNGFEGFLTAVFGGNDKITGSKGDDYILGFGGKDTINGGAGSDLLDGSSGNGDVLIGGKGDDYFSFSHGNGKDVVKDFDAKGVKDGDFYYGHDTIYLSTSDYHITSNKAGDAVIVLDGTGDTLTLSGVHKSDLHDYNFSVWA